MLRQRKNMLQKRKEMVLIERKEKMIERKKKANEKEKERQNIKMGNECSSWQTPPEDVVEKILEFLEFADQRRLGQVSKFWRSIVYQTFMRRARCQLPWLILSESKNCMVNKYVRFLTFPENKLSRGKVVKLKLPKQLQGGWIYGASKGWLIIIKEKGLDSKMCILNPVSGILHKLPPLRTIPSFKNYVKTREWELLGASGFCRCVKMSSTSNNFYSPRNFIVAAIFDVKEETLGLCRPGDETWSIFSLSDCLLDILFSSGTLYALVRSKQNDGGVAPTRTLNFALDDAEPLKLKVVFDIHEYISDIVDTYDGDYKIVSNATYWSMLLESTSKEVMLIHHVVDYVLKRVIDGDEDTDGFEGNSVAEGDEIADDGDIDGFEGNSDDEGDDEEVVDQNTRNVCYRTSSFRTYKMDPYNNNFHMLQSMGGELIFVGDDDVFSLPASNIKGIENNCIYFAMNAYRTMDLEWLPQTRICDEFGIFYLDGQRIEKPSQGMEMKLKYQASWFTPSL